MRSHQLGCVLPAFESSSRELRVRAMKLILALVRLARERVRRHGRRHPVVDPAQVLFSHVRPHPRMVRYRLPSPPPRPPPALLRFPRLGQHQSVERRYRMRSASSTSCTSPTSVRARSPTCGSRSPRCAAADRCAALRIVSTPPARRHRRLLLVDILLPRPGLNQLQVLLARRSAARPRRGFS